MSKEVTAAILTYLYFQHIDPDTGFLLTTPDERGYNRRKVDMIGKVYAVFLRDIPTFEAPPKE